MSTIKVHVICCNDYPEFAFVGNLNSAYEKMEKLREVYYEANKMSFNCSYEAYKRRCYWYIRTVDGVIEKEPAAQLEMRHDETINSESEGMTIKDDPQFRDDLRKMMVEQRSKRGPVPHA